MQQQMLCGDEVHSAVVDLGTAVSKFGSAGHDLPRYVLRSDIGEIDESSLGGGKRYVFGDTGLRMLREDMAIRSLNAFSPVKWEHVEQLMQYSINRYMKLPSSEVPILFADNTITGAVNLASGFGSPSAGSSNKEKEKMMQVCFESLRSPAVYMISSGVLSSFSTGRTTGLVIDIGAAGTRIMPIVDGYELRSCSVFTRRGGTWLDDMLLWEIDAQLRKSYPTAANMQSINSSMKGKGAAIAAGGTMRQPGARLYDINNSVVRPWFETKISPTDEQKLMHSTFREIHIRALVQDLKEWMCFVPYAPINLPEHLMQPNPVSQPALPTGKTTAAAASAAAAAIATATASAMQQHADAVSEYRVQELQNRSLQFPPPYELPDGNRVVASDKICTAPEQMFFNHPLPEPVLVMQPPKLARSKSKTASNAAAQAAAVAAASAQAAAQAAAAAAASKKRARAILEEQIGSPTTDSNSTTVSPESSMKLSSTSRARSSSSNISAIGKLNNVKVDEESLSDLIFLCVSQCDVDVRRELLGNIQVVGGGSRIEGIAQRLAFELTEIVPSHIKVKVVPALPMERHYAPWIGGSILSICGSFQQLWMTRSEYEEHGAERCAQRFDH